MSSQFATTNDGFLTAFLKAKRTRKLTQGYLARHLGVTQAYVSQLMHGNRMPSEKVVRRLKEYFFEVNPRAVESWFGAVDVSTFRPKGKFRLRTHRDEFLNNRPIEELSGSFFDPNNIKWLIESAEAKYKKPTKIERLRRRLVFINHRLASLKKLAGCP